MADNRPQTILNKLRRTFTMPKWITSTKDPFKTLIATIISQNTADRNTARAFEKLSKRFEITPEVLAKAKTREIEQCLRVSRPIPKQDKSNKTSIQDSSRRISRGPEQRTATSS